jgi:hypothetical protein
MSEINLYYAYDVQNVGLSADVACVDCVMMWINCISRKWIIVSFIYIVIYDLFSGKLNHNKIYDNFYFFNKTKSQT